MLNTLMSLLGRDVAIFRRYLIMVVLYGLLNGITVVLLVPLLSHLLAGEVRPATFWLAGFLGCAALAWWWRVQVDKAGVRVGVSVLCSGRLRLGDHVAGLPVGWFTPANTARLSHVVSHGLMEVAQLPAHVFTPVFGGLVTPLVMVLALFVLNGQMGLIALLALPLLAVVFWLATRLGRQVDRRFHDHAADTSQRLVEFAQAQSVLRAFNGEGAGARFLAEAIDRQHRSARQLIYPSILAVTLNAWVVQAVFAALLLAAVFWLNQALMAGQSSQSLIAVTVALLLSYRFVEPLLEVAGYGEALRGARNQLDGVREILAAQPLPQPPQPQSPADHSVALRDVRFRYGASETEVLRGVNLEVAPGSMVALVGASGSGKTTLMRLVARFFDVTGGQVLVGGIDVRQMTSDQLAAQISQVFQDTYLFQGSIADNIRLGRPGASDNELAEVVRLAGVETLVERLPEGLETLVGEGGARLSGGERQRIAIARALIKDAPILLVDEATAALDTGNQAIIAETLARLRGKRTLIVIAHQLSTITSADRIVVLEDGAVCEQGCHRELAAAGGRYARFLTQRESAKGWQVAGGQSHLRQAEHCVDT
ncbi:ABC transporter ATP-binding protein [Marinobacter xestospongiae]|uniref:ABC transporter ATP-binding protein n=1 Tax=Marinobacter xestospongiae TaxID=994319 RepID=UPI002002C87B|nr:ABC transporter ATP-binding protein [Marinobacter xestospongiae]MCK7568329.1 ABC transporter ATP-binding protein/permease [Marinobacter xestospongiae]